MKNVFPLNPTVYCQSGQLPNLQNPNATMNEIANNLNAMMQNPTFQQFIKQVINSLNQLNSNGTNATGYTG